MLTTLTVSLAILLAAPAPKEGAKEAKLEGNWQLAEAEGAGPKGSKEELEKKPVRFVIEKDVIKIIETREPAGKERIEEATYEVDMTKKPATINIKPKGAPKEIVVQGIIEVDANTLKLCFGRNGKERPKEFKGDASKDQQLMIFKRLEEKK